MPIDFKSSTHGLLFMNSKSLTIIAIVAIVVAGVTYGTYILDSDDDLELRDYLVEGDWIEYYYANSDFTQRCTVVDVKSIDMYAVNFSDQYTIEVAYAYLLTVVDVNDESIEYIGTEKIDTFLGNIDCEIYLKNEMNGLYKYYVEPETKLLLISKGIDLDGDPFSMEITGTSVFDPVDLEFSKISLTQPGKGSSFGYETNFTYRSGYDFFYESSEISTEVTSINDDGTLNIVGKDEPVTVEEMMSELTFDTEDYDSWTLMGTKVVSTQWGLMKCNEYCGSSSSDDDSSRKSGMLVDSDTGLIIKVWVEDSEVLFDGLVWDHYYESSTLQYCNLIQIVG